MASKNDDLYALDSNDALKRLRNNLLQASKNANFVKVSNKTQTKDSNGEKYEKGTMFADIQEIEQFNHNKGINVYTNLSQFEKELIAKKHVSRICHHPKCNQRAPAQYPNNIYICDKHKKPLREKLEQHQIKYTNLTQQQRIKCRQIENAYQKVIDSLKVPDNQQTFGNNQHKYPTNYFSIAMTKLIYCHQELSKNVNNANATYKSGRRKSKKIVERLMDLLIYARQNLNCHWYDVCNLILIIITTIGAGFAWVVTNNAFIAALGAFLAGLIGIIINGFIFGDKDIKYVAGAAAVGTGVGITAGAACGATMAWAGAESGATIGATVGTVGGPMGTAAGATVGAIVGGISGFLIGGGIAAMIKYA